MRLIIAFTIILLTLLILALLAFRQYRQLKAKAKECSKEAQRFQQKLQELTAPDHFFTDEEQHHLKREYAPLLRETNRLYNSVLISKEYLDSLELNRFLEKRRLLNHLQLQNNNKFQQQQ